MLVGPEGLQRAAIAHASNHRRPVKIADDFPASQPFGPQSNHPPLRSPPTVTMARTRGKPKAKALEEANQALAQELEELQGRFDRLDVKYRKKKAATKKLSRRANTIPKPRGEHGRDFNLQDAMGLGDRRGTYLSMLALIRSLIDRAQLEPRAWFRRQDPVKVLQIYIIARDEFPMLKQFQADWATAEMVKQALRNRRHRRAKRHIATRLDFGPELGYGDDSASERSSNPDSDTTSEASV